MMCSNPYKYFMELLKNNYLRTFGHGSQFTVEIDPPRDKNGNFHLLSRTLAETIQENKEGPIYVLYSGGLDSEYVLNTFLSLKINVIPVIIKLNPDYNNHDVKYAFDFCQSKKLKPLIIDVDFNNFVKSGKIVDLAERFKIGAYQLPCTFDVLEKLDGTIVMGSHGSPHLFYNKEKNKWFIDEYEPIHTVLDFFKTKKIHGCPFFLVHTAEQYLSFLLDPNMKKLVNNEFPGKLGNNSTKYLVYNNGSDFNLTNRQKYTGYENIEKSEIFNHENLKFFNDTGKQWWGIYAIEYHELIGKLLG
jgi:hypothetical protein